MRMKSKIFDDSDNNDSTGGTKKRRRSEHYSDDEGAGCHYQAKGYKKNFMTSHTGVFSGSIGSRCSPSMFMDVANKLSEEQKKKVEEIGFGGLLKIPTTQCLRQLDFWMLCHFDIASQSFEFGGGRSIPLKLECVHRVLGIPHTGLRVKENNSHDDCVVQMKEKYSNSRSITLQHLKVDIERGKAGDMFARSFMLLALHTVIAPSTSVGPSIRYLKVLMNDRDIPKYNWAEYLIDKVGASAKWVQAQMNKGKSIFWISGSTLFLGLYYLEWIEVVGHEVKKDFPRVALWGNEDIAAFEKADKVSTRGEYGAYGRCKIRKVEHTCFADIFSWSIGADNRTGLSDFNVPLDDVTDDLSIEERAKLRSAVAKFEKSVGSHLLHA